MSSASGKPATILVVDDEITDLEFMSFALSNEGHTVLTAGGADDALRVASEAGAIDLLITDVAMPATSGTELAKALQGRQPSLKVLFVSGYPGSEVLRYQWLQNGATHFLRKPFPAEVLIDAVRRLLSISSGLSNSTTGAGGES